MYYYRLSEHGRVFSTRERGARLRADIEHKLALAPVTEPFVLDFADVDIISFSVADEVVARLIANRDQQTDEMAPILVANANEDVVDSIVRALERRDVVGACLTDDGVTLLNAPPHLVDTFAAAERRGEFRASELAADLGIAVPACNNRLQRLLAAGLLARFGGIPRTGGREFVYRVTVPARKVVTGIA